MEYSDYRVLPDISCSITALIVRVRVRVRVRAIDTQCALRVFSHSVHNTPYACAAWGGGVGVGTDRESIVTICNVYIAINEEQGIQLQLVYMD